MDYFLVVANETKSNLPPFTQIEMRLWISFIIKGPLVMTRNMIPNDHWY